MTNSSKSSICIHSPPPVPVTPPSIPIALFMFQNKPEMGDHGLPFCLKWWSGKVVDRRDSLDHHEWSEWGWIETWEAASEHFTCWISAPSHFAYLCGIHWLVSLLRWGSRGSSWLSVGSFWDRLPAIRILRKQEGFLPYMLWGWEVVYAEFIPFVCPYTMHCTMAQCCLVQLLLHLWGCCCASVCWTALAYLKDMIELQEFSNCNILIIGLWFALNSYRSLRSSSIPYTVTWLALKYFVCLETWEIGCLRMCSRTQYHVLCRYPRTLDLVLEDYLKDVRNEKEQDLFHQFITLSVSGGKYQVSQNTFFCRVQPYPSF